MTDIQNMYEKNRISYVITFALSVIFIFIALDRDNHENLVLAVPTLLLSAIGLIKKEHLILPPTFVAMITITIILLQLTNMAGEDYGPMDTVADIFLGIMTCVLGLMIVFALLKSTSGMEIGKPFFISFTAFCIAVSLSMFLTLGEYLVDYAYDLNSSREFRDFVYELISNIIGAFIVAALFYMNRNLGLFQHTLNRFIARNSDSLGVDDNERKQALEEIEKGESSKLEFKSTLRTNLKTGEKDPRMERAVLKTIVAYLNSRGGTLYVGVADDGTILGIDIESFENSKDKFGLHLNNLITKQIGGEFLPYIDYHLIEFDDKSIMKVKCQSSNRPVFLNDGKEEIFYVRSGPSTVELHGMELLYYTNHNFGKMLKKKN